MFGFFCCFGDVFGWCGSLFKICLVWLVLVVIVAVCFWLFCWCWVVVVGVWLFLRRFECVLLFLLV